MKFRRESNTSFLHLGNVIRKHTFAVIIIVMPLKPISIIKIENMKLLTND